MNQNPKFILFTCEYDAMKLEKKKYKISKIYNYCVFRVAKIYTLFTFDLTIVFIVSHFCPFTYKLQRYQNICTGKELINLINAYVISNKCYFLGGQDMTNS